jgi:hypothetical protein
MPYQLKTLIVVLAIASAVLFLTKPIVLRFMSEEDFSRRRLVWFILTTVGFLSPNIWLYALVAVPVLIWIGRRDSNPIALYLFLLHVIPPVGVAIPILGNNGLFELNNYRLLAFCVLLPAVIRYRKSRDAAAQSEFGVMDVLLLTLGVLEVALYTPPDLPFHVVIPDSFTNALRRAVLFLLDSYLLFYAITRLCRSRKQLVDALACFCFACAIMAAIAMFERTRNWLLYVDIAGRWLPNNPNAMFYLTRGGGVRAQVAAGHSIALGYMLAIAFGFWLYLRSHVQKRIQRVGVTLLLWGGSFAAFSRGGWLGATAVYFTFIMAGPRAVSRLVKGGAIALFVAGLVLVSPVGDRVIAMLPTKGAPADEYRHNLSERGWEVVLAHPFFGDQFPWPKLEDLRQGEGIIDLVNVYLSVALSYGFVGLFIFWTFILVALFKAYGRARNLTLSDPDLAMIGTSLVAAIAGVLIMLDTSSFIMGVEKMFFVLAAFATAYARLDRLPAMQPVSRRATLLRS